MVTCRLLAAASAAGVPGAAARAARRSAAAAATRWRRAHSALAASPETEPAQQQTWADAAPAAGEAATLAARGTLVATEAVLALELPARLAGEVVSGLRALLLRGGRAVVAAPGGGAASLRRRVLLSPDVAPPGGVAPPAVAALLRRPLALEAGETAPALVTHALVTPYERLTAVQVLRALLPPGVVPPTSFEEAGHVLHLNLRSEQLPWARLIGAVLLDKGAPRVATVVNKAGPVGGPFRTAPLVLLAGEPRYVASVCEAGLVFRVDVRSVYWNSRLGPERARLVALFAPGHGVLDLAAGCGPIALQAARRGCRVWAADANPAACEALGANALANGLRLQGGGPHCGCGAAFAQSLLRGAPPPLVHHVVAHAPDGGPELVGAALRGAFAAWPADWALPSVHVYAFARPGLPGDAEAATRARLAAALGVAPHALAVNWTRVRDVAPGKAVLRASFQLPDDMRRQEEA